jgi:rhodanese-related sulfurtransferase
MNLDACELNRWELFRREQKNLNRAGFEQVLREHPEAVILDVRTKQEFSEWQIPGAIHMDYFAYDLLDRFEEMDKNLPYLIYCRSGRRSVRVCVLMRNSGFTNLYNLDGGLKNW